MSQLSHDASESEAAFTPVELAFNGIAATNIFTSLFDEVRFLSS